MIHLVFEIPQAFRLLSGGHGWCETLIYMAQRNSIQLGEKIDTTLKASNSATCATVFITAVTIIASFSFMAIITTTRIAT